MINRQVVNGILKYIKTKVPALDWDFVSKYHNGEDISVMELRLFQHSTTKYFGKFTFDSDSGLIIRGAYGKALSFDSNIYLTDALLDVLSFELKKNPKIVLT